MSELEQLRQEAEQLKNQIRVSDTICFPIQHLAFVCGGGWVCEIMLPASLNIWLETSFLFLDVLCEIFCPFNCCYRDSLAVKSV